MGALVLWLLFPFLAIVATENRSNYTVHQFLTDIHRTEDFRQVLILKNANVTFNDNFGRHFVKDLSVAVEIPLLVFTESTSFFLEGKFNSRLLIVVYLERDSDVLILERMVEILRGITLSKVVFLFNYRIGNKLVLKKLFDFCWTNSVINVLAIDQDFSTSAAFYRYTRIPTFAIEQLRATKEPPAGGYYPNRMNNLKGHRMRVAFGGSEPKIIFSKADNNGPHIGGYIGNLFQALAKKHNITLVPTITTKVLSARELLDFVQNGTVDISAAHTWTNGSMLGFTYPYENINWCLMIPIEPNIPGYKLFMIVFRVETLAITIGFIALLSAVLEYTKRISGVETNLISYIINDNCLRGVMGQSFSEIRNAPLRIRYIYLLICLLGIILTSSYNSYLQTYVTSPPSVAKLRTFDDLLASGRKVYILREEFGGMPKFFTKEQLQMFTLEDNFTNYLALRDSFNTTYAYIVNNVKWTIVQEQQKLFTRPLFRHPDEMCVYHMMPMAFPINVNSIFKDIINRLMLQTHSSGLLPFWHKKSYNELIEAGDIKPKDLTSKPCFVPMKVEDLRMVMVVLAVGLFLASLCFLMEIFMFRWKCLGCRFQSN